MRRSALQVLLQPSKRKLAVIKVKDRSHLPDCALIEFHSNHLHMVSRGENRPARPAQTVSANRDDFNAARAACFTPLPWSNRAPPSFGCYGQPRRDAAVVTVEYINGANNILADCLSRIE